MQPSICGIHSCENISDKRMQNQMIIITDAHIS